MCRRKGGTVSIPGVYIGFLIRSRRRDERVDAENGQTNARYIISSWRKSRRARLTRPSSSPIGFPEGRPGRLPHVPRQEGRVHQVVLTP